MNFAVEVEREEDGRWIAEIVEIPGVLTYGVTPLQAGKKAKALALRVTAERMESEVSLPGINSIEFRPATPRPSLPKALIQRDELFGVLQAQPAAFPYNRLFLLAQVRFHDERLVGEMRQKRRH